MQALLFPGQGSQKAGMGQGLFERFPEITQTADSVLGYSIAELCLKNPESRLSNTRYAQPAIYVVNALHLAAREEDEGKQTAFAAGHSLGEYCALMAAGVFDFEVGLELVSKRGELFEAAGGGGMVALLGITASHVRHLLKQADRQEVSVANLNSRYQTVISGPREHLDSLRQTFEEAGCMLYRELDVSGPFHSPHMKDAKEAFAAFLQDYEFSEPRFPVISNVTARPYRYSRTRDFLLEQIDHPVKWYESVHYLMRNGVTEFREVGNGGVLTKIGNAIVRDLSSNH